MPARTVADWSLLTLLVLMWGSGFSLTRIAVADIAPAWTVAIRLAVGALALLPFLWFSRNGPKPLGALLGWLAALAVLGNVLPFWLAAWGLQHVSSGLGAILIGFMPLATLLIAGAVLPEEKITARRLLGFLAGFAGLVVLVGPGSLMALGGAGPEVIAQLALIAAALSYALNGVIARLAPPLEPYAKSFAVMSMAALLSWPLAMAEAPVAANSFTPGAVIAVIALGIFPTGLATVVYFKLIDSAGPGFMALTNYLVPPFALIVGAFFLGEAITLEALLGLGLILFGVAVAEVRRKSRPR